MEILRLEDLRKGGARTIQKQQEWAEEEEKTANIALAKALKIKQIAEKAFDAVSEEPETFGQRHEKLVMNALVAKQKVQRIAAQAKMGSEYCESATNRVGAAVKLLHKVTGWYNKSNAKATRLSNVAQEEAEKAETMLVAAADQPMNATLTENAEMQKQRADKFATAAATLMERARGIARTCDQNSHEEMDSRQVEEQVCHLSGLAADQVKQSKSVLRMAKNDLSVTVSCGAETAFESVCCRALKSKRGSSERRKSNRRSKKWKK
jgi:hypothetical protein